MKFQLIENHGPGYVKIDLQSDESIICESGAMMAMSSHLDVQPIAIKKGAGSVVAALKSAVSGGGIFFSKMTSLQKSGELYLAPALHGQIHEIKIDGVFYIAAPHFLTADSNLEFDLVWRGMGNLISGQGLYWVKVSGQGSVLINGFGAIEEKHIQNHWVVDSGHLIAFGESIQVQASKAGHSWFGSFLGGEGIVSHLKGSGKIYVQSHNLSAFGHNLSRYLKQRG